MRLFVLEITSQSLNPRDQGDEIFDSNVILIGGLVVGEGVSRSLGGYGVYGGKNVGSLPRHIPSVEIMIGSEGRLFRASTNRCHFITFPLCVTSTLRS